MASFESVGARPSVRSSISERKLCFVFPATQNKPWLSTLRVSFFDISDRSESRSVAGLAGGESVAIGGRPYRVEAARAKRGFAGRREPNPASGKEKAMSSPSDAEVIGRSLGEPEAFGADLRPPRRRSLLRFLGRRAGAEVAEGLLGELFRIAFERRKTFDSSRAQRAAVAVRDRLEPAAASTGAARRGGCARARAWRRARRPRTGARRAAALDARVLFPRVADAIESLPDGEREALLLFAWEELSYQSVAEALELPIGTVRSRLNRARAHLRELLEPSGKSRVRSR